MQAAGDLLIESSAAGRDPYEFANHRILEEAVRLAADSGENPVAVVVWDGGAGKPGDFTESFAVLARKRGMAVLHVSTLE